MTQPSPQPTTGTFGGITLEVPETSGSATDLYGVGAWGTQPVNPGDLPFLSGLITSGEPITGEAIVKGFANAAPTDVATMQHALLMAGYYSSTYTPRYGVISPDDIKAFGDAVRVAGQSGMDVTTLLEQGAAYGAAAGIAAAQAQNTETTSSGTVTVLPNKEDLAAVADAAFQKVLGKKATAKEKAQFAAMYRAMAARQQREMAHAQGGTVELSGPLATGDPSEIVGQAINPDQAPQTMLEHALGTGAPVDVSPPGFTEQIGNLMTLGQSLNAAQQAAQQEEYGGADVTVDALEDPSVAAQNFARSRHPKGAAATDVAGTFQSFLNILNRSFA